MTGKHIIKNTTRTGEYCGLPHLIRELRSIGWCNLPWNKHELIIKFIEDRFNDSFRVELKPAKVIILK